MIAAAALRPLLPARPRPWQWSRLLLLAGALAAQAAPPAGPAEGPPEVPPEVLASRPSSPPPTPPPTTTPDPTELFAQLRLLQEFLALSPEELQRIRLAVAFIEGLEPAERERMRARLARIQLDYPQLDEDLAVFAPWVEPAEKGRFRRLWLRLSPEVRTAVLARFENLAPPERRAWIVDQLTRQSAEEHRILSQLSGNPPK